MVATSNGKKSKKAAPEPELEPEKEVTEEEKRKRSSNRRLLNSKKRQSGYRLRATKAGSKADVLGRLFSAEDVRRMTKLCPSDSVLSYSSEEFYDRATLSLTPFPGSSAYALVPSVDALARHIVVTAAKASYTAGRPSATPWDLLNASREIIGALDFECTGPEGLIAYGQNHDSRGELVAGRSAAENARFPILPYGDDDVDVEKKRKATVQACAGMLLKAKASVKTKKTAVPTPAPAPPPAPPPAKAIKKKKK